MSNFFINFSLIDLFKTSKIIPFIVSLVFVFSNFLFSQQITIVGRVLDSETKQPIPGVRIQVLNSNRGTYTSSSGFFRLPNVSVGNKIAFKSIGYEQTIKEIVAEFDTLVVYLRPSPVEMKGIEKVGEIEADEIVRRAIKKKKSNLANLKTFQAQIYSKLFLEFGGTPFETTFDTVGGSKILRAKARSKSKTDSLALEFYRNIILETFSNVFIDYSQNIKYSEITQRRQTANIPKELNQIVFSEFLSFYEETIKIMSTEFVTPLADNAFKYYKYELLGKELYGDLYVYNLQIIPKTTLYPAFSGTMKILERTYNLLEINVAPSENSAIQFFDSLRYTQKFTSLSEEFWQPTFLEVSGSFKLVIIKSFLDFDIKFRIVSIVADAVINQSLPDSIVAKATQSRITVSTNADSTDTNFWETNSLVETSAKENEIYKKVDTISKQVKIDFSNLPNSTPQKRFNLGIDLANDIGYNRVSGYSIGLSPYIEYYRYKLKLTPIYSFAQKNFFYDAGFSINLGKEFGTTSSQLSISIFSKPEPISLDRNMPLQLNSLFSYFFHWDYYDYLKNQGFKVEYSLLNQSIKPYIKMTLGFESSKQTSLAKKTDWSVFSKTIWRDNPEIFEGKFDIFRVGFTVTSNQDLFGIVINRNNSSYKIDLNFLFGRMNKGLSFGIINPRITVEYPTLYTGYQPMFLKVLLEMGLATKETPPQCEFKMPNAWGFGNFLTAKTAWFGGKRYYAIHLQHSFSDLLWRAIGLPTIKGRGFELSALLSLGFFSNYGNSQIYKPNDKLFYEFGFGLSRIPIFVSDFLNWGMDFKFSFDKVNTRGFGFSLNLSLPF